MVRGYLRLSASLKTSNKRVCRVSNRCWEHGGGSLKFDGEGRAQWRGDIGIDGGSFRKINRRMAPHAPSPPTTVGNPGIR